jgi:hypothetical protein
MNPPENEARWVVVQFGSLTSQTRHSCVAKHRDTSRGSLRLFAAQKRLAQDDVQTASLPRDGSA